MIGIIIQARTGSTRLPNKMILPFFNEYGIFEIILKKLHTEIQNIPIILATTTSINDNILVSIAEKYKTLIYRGSEIDVLDRFIKAAQKFNIDKIIRVCADNPFIDTTSLKFQIEQFSRTSCDYWCYSLKDNTPTIITHYGFWGEGVCLNTLCEISDKTNDLIFREHVTNYIYNTKNDFIIWREYISEFIENYRDIRLTIDTINDFKLASSIYNKLSRKGHFNINDIINFIKENPKILDDMKIAISSNKK